MTKIKEILYTISPNQKMNFLNDKYLSLEKDIISIASIVFNIETIFRMGKEIFQVKIPISEETADRCDLTKIKKEIEDLLFYVLVKNVNIEFDVKENMSLYKRDRNLDFKNTDNICLFSGGVDSLSGIITLNSKIKNLQGVYVAHGDQPKGVAVVTTLQKDILNKLHIPINILYAPPMKRFGYSQLRGFLACQAGR